MGSFQVLPTNLAVLQRHWGYYLGLGIVLVLLGTMAIAAIGFTTLLTVTFLGALILITGITLLVDTFRFWWKRWSGFFIHLLMALLYVGLGLMFLMGPIATSLSLTLLLAITFIVIGIVRISNSLSLKPAAWKWTLFNGIITALLGVLILMEWPASGLFVIGLFVGIDLLLCGWTYVMMALTAKASKEKVKT